IGTANVPWSTMYEIRSSVLRFKESGKPVFASSEDFVDTESEYYLMSAADSIYAVPEGIFEFNGFAIVASFYRGLLDKLEIEPNVIRAGTYKSAGEAYVRKDFSDENAEQLQAILDVHEAHFFDAIAQSRGVGVDELRRLATTDAIITADQALDAGLVSGLLQEDQIAERWKEVLGLESDAKLASIDLKRYSRVPASAAGIATGNEGEVAIVYAVGTILSGDGEDDSPFTSGFLGSASFTRAMREARESEKVKAVVLRVNSPGGFAPAADAMLREIELTAAEKPVVVSMGDLAASGGYWISAPADAIVATPLTITGSIGVFSLFFDTGDFFADKLGITFDHVATSAYADMFSGVRPLSDGEEALLQDLTDRTYERFLHIVADGRSLSIDDVRSLAEGRVWIGADALARNLVDSTGDLHAAIEVAAAKAGLAPDTYRVRALPRPKSFLQRMTGSMDAQASALWERMTLSVAERALIRQARTLREALVDHGTVQARLPVDIAIR
ncbi:MAG: signal peptide peptidase SppA, partial [Rhodothermales bacterium]|nr:signal peptide peptidase SppA [Rhodothermales bacterium]